MSITMKFKLPPFIMNVLTLVSGTVLAHIITLVVLPILSRIYNQQQFGELAVLMSSSAILSIFMSLKLEMAVFNHNTLDKRSKLVITCLFITCVNLSVCYLTLWFFESKIVSLFDTESIKDVIHYVPLAALLLAWFNLFTNFAIAEKSYKAVAATKVVRSAALAGFQLFFSFFTLGLILGEVISRFFGIYSLSKKTLFSKSVKLKGSPLLFCKTLKENKKFIQFSTPAGMMNMGSLQLPTLIIASSFSVVAAGLYLMTQRIIAVPLVLLGQSLAQVYSSEFATLNSDKPKRLKLFHDVSIKSGLIAIGFFCVLALIAPYIIDIALGSEWHKVADYIVLLCPMFALQLAVAPISNTLNMLNKQQYMMLWDTIRLGCLVILLVLTQSLSFDIEAFLLFYSFIMAGCYLLLYFISLYFVKKNI